MDIRQPDAQVTEQLIEPAGAQASFKGKPLFKLQVPEKMDLTPDDQPFGKAAPNQEASAKPPKAVKDVNDIPGQLRSCYVNEVKSAKELKISIQPNPSSNFNHVWFYPNIPYSKKGDQQKLEFNRRKPQGTRGDPGTQPNPMIQSSQTLYSTELDKWMLQNKKLFEDWRLTRGICRIYAIFLADKTFRFQAGTGILTKVAERKVIASCLSVAICDLSEDDGKFFAKTGRPVLLASFGSEDLSAKIYSNLKAKKDFKADSIVSELLDQFSTCLTPISLVDSGLAARKEWLTENTTKMEVCDSEFFDQTRPSLDFAFYLADPDWLKERQIKPIMLSAPDHKYIRIASIGFNQPRLLDHSEWRKRYAHSKSVSKDEIFTLNEGKSVSFGKVRSYGSLTAVVNSLGRGSQGSPVFNELGKCWGIVQTCHNDLPDKILDSLVQKIDCPDGSDDEGSSKAKKKGKKKKDKKKKKEKKEDNRKDQDILKKLGPEYYDFESHHLIKPLVPAANSFNRNFVLSMSHSGVKFIIDKVAKQLTPSETLAEHERQLFVGTKRAFKEYSKFSEENESYLKNSKARSEMPAIQQVSDDLKAIARQKGKEGMATSMQLYSPEKGPSAEPICISSETTCSGKSSIQKGEAEKE